MPVFTHPEAAAHWVHSLASTGQLHSDSRALQPGDALLAWPGARSDARHFVPQALAGGARACLVEAAGWNAAAALVDDPRVGAYLGLKAAAPAIAAAFYRYPTRELALMAVTGTNGKTSTAWWLAQALSRCAPWCCATVGTLGVGFPGQTLGGTGLTTPDPVRLQQALRQLVDAGARACTLEASSIGLVQGRLDACSVRTAIFTNLTQDHLDYHGDMSSYAQAKRGLFLRPELSSAVINIDDAFGARLAQGALPDLWTVSATQDARLRLVQVRHLAQGMELELAEGDRRARLCTSAMGAYNASNLLGVVAAMRSLGIDLDAAVQACTGLGAVPGRMQRVAADPDQPLVVIDYAHTPDALAKALQALRPVAAARGGRLWCVFGCGGDRDNGKRPLMGALAQQHADHVVLTSDNPRSERPQAIVAQILLGIADRHAVGVEVDRGRAIALALQQAAAADVVLIAGKGHEQTQEIAGVFTPFCDATEAQKALVGRYPPKDSTA